MKFRTKEEIKRKIDEMKHHYGVDNYAQLAEKIGKSKSLIDSWIRTLDIKDKYLRDLNNQEYREVDRKSLDEIEENEMESNDKKGNLFLSNREEDYIFAESIDKDKMARNIYKMCKEINNKRVLDVFRYTVRKWTQEKREKNKKDIV